MPGILCVQPCQLALEKCGCNLGRVQVGERTCWSSVVIWTHMKALMGSCPPRTGEVLGTSGLVSACCRAGTLLLLGWRSGATRAGGRVCQVPGCAVRCAVCTEMCSEVLCLGTTAAPALQRSPCNKTLWELGKWELQSAISALKRCCLSLLSLLGL